MADAEAAEHDGAWPGHPLDEVREDARLSSLYFGSAGMIWALSRLGSTLDAPAGIAAALDRYRLAPDLADEGLGHAPSLLMGETGVLVVADKLSSPAADRDRLSELVRANREHPTWEFLWGSPGTILAARACGLDDEWRESAGVALRAVGRVLGHMDGRALRSPAALPRSRPRLRRQRARAPRIRRRRGSARAGGEAADPDRGARDGLVNWPPIDGPLSEYATTIRVQWCHGAPGIVITLGDLMPIELAIGGGELTWRAGPLRKGPGLCHGTAGNGFAFLTLHDLTGDPVWLERARRFAMHAIEQVERERASLGRGRYTLWTGDVGVALYVRACIDADPRFPIMDVL